MDMKVSTLGIIIEFCLCDWNFNYTNSTAQLILQTIVSFAYNSVGTEDACIVEQLFNCSLMAMVNFSSPRKLKVCHFRKETEICNYSYSNTILSVKLNRAVSYLYVAVSNRNCLSVVQATLFKCYRSLFSLDF